MSTYQPDTPIRSICGGTRRIVVASGNGYTVVRSHDWHIATAIDDTALAAYWTVDARELARRERENAWQE